MRRGRSPSCPSPSPCGGGFRVLPGCAPAGGVTFSRARESNQRERLGGGRRFDFGSEGRSLAHRRPPPKNPLFRARAVDFSLRGNDRLAGIWTGFSPIGAAACVRLLSHAVPSVDACVVRLKFRGGVGKPPISRGTAHIAMPSPHRGEGGSRRLTDEGASRETRLISAPSSAPACPLGHLPPKRGKACASFPPCHNKLASPQADG